MEKFKRKEDVHGNIIEHIKLPEFPNQPVFRIRENREQGMFTAEFAIDLAGVTRGENKKAKYHDNQYELSLAAQERYRGTILAGLSSSHALRFVYTVGTDDDGTLNFKWRVGGYYEGVSADETIWNIYQLWQNANVILSVTEKDYHFSPVSDAALLDENVIEEGWVATIKPVGLTLNTEKHVPMGFLRDVKKDRQTRIIIPSHVENSSIRNFDSILIGASGCQSPVRLELSISPFALNDEEKNILADALNAVGKGYASQFKNEAEIKKETEDDKAMKKIEDNLELWVRNPAGLKISCMAVSASPIPLSYLSMIGNEIFRGTPVAIQTAKFRSNDDALPAVSNSENGPLLDLHDCINSSCGIPVAFPSVKALTDAGAKRVFSQSPGETSKSGIVLGHVSSGRQSKNICFSHRDRSKHAYIIGATGAGKSTLLYNMIKQDIDKGEGVTLIDPHGDLYNQVLHSIPQYRINDVVLINPCDFDYSVGMNFLECTGGHRSVQLNFLANQMIRIFDKLYDLRQTGGPIFETYLRNSLFLLTESHYSGATLMDVPLLFEDRTFRTFLKEQCINPLIVSFWTRQAETAGGEASLSNVAPYITSKLNQFTTNGLLRPIIGQTKSTIDFRQAMDTRKIVLINLSKGLLGELDAMLLGGLILGKIFSSAMGRVAIRPEQRKPMYLYIDEFQNFVTDSSISFMLSEARKFCISLNLANQTLAQLNTDAQNNHTMDAVLGNVGSMLIFRLGPKDAETMEAYVRPDFSDSDLQALPDYHVAARLLNNNAPGRPFVFKTLPVFKAADAVSVKSIVEMSRSKYSVTTAKVEKDIIYKRNNYKEFTVENLDSAADEMTVSEVEEDSEDILAKSITSSDMNSPHRAITSVHARKVVKTIHSTAASV